MKTTTIGMFAAIAFAVGMVGINFSDGQLKLQDSTSDATIDGAGVLGHIEVIQRDSEGNIKSYQQTDNAIVNDGRNCVSMLLFGPNTGCGAASSSGLGKYTFIGLGNTTSLSGGTEIKTLPSEVVDSPVLGLERKAGTLGTFTNATASGASATQRISATFTWNGASTNTVLAAGLFNTTYSATPANYETFALKNFPSSVAMNPGDQLTVNWDISISGTNPYS